MGYKEAQEDGVRRGRITETNESYYYPKCCECGKEMFSYSYIRGKKYTCKDCKQKNYFSDKEKRVDRSNEAKESKFENALKRIKSAVGESKFKKYEKAIATVKKNLYHYGWFDSTEEIMVAIELLKNDLRVRHQVRVNRYKVDFVLPDLQIILEVDGHLFHTKETRERERTRDSLLILAFGPEWEVVRVSDDRINEDISKLVPAIKKIVSRRKLLRKNSEGQLPKWYSDRE